MRKVKLPCITHWTYNYRPRDSRPVLGECIINPDMIAAIQELSKDNISIHVGEMSLQIPLSLVDFEAYCKQATEEINERVVGYAQSWEGIFSTDAESKWPHKNNMDDHTQNDDYRRKRFHDDNSSAQSILSSLKPARGFLTRLFT